MTLRDELTEGQWGRIRDLLPGRQESVGRTAADHRAFVNGVLWVLRSGARWSDWPERSGKHKSVHQRFSRGATSGVWDRVFRTLAKDKSDQYLMIDSTIVRAHQQAATGRKKEGPDQALGRSRGGLTTKIHLLCNELGKPIDFLLTGGQVADCTQALALLGARQPRFVVADKGYDADAIVQHVEASGAQPVIPPRGGYKKDCVNGFSLEKKERLRRTDGNRQRSDR